MEGTKLHPGRQAPGSAGLLYMPALVAAHHNPGLKHKYQTLLARGKPPKVALTTVMRKLLVLANALLQENRTWTAHAPGAQA